MYPTLFLKFTRYAEESQTGNASLIELLAPNKPV